MSIPRVYAAINAVAVELASVGLPKGHINLEDQYAYRGIDDVYNRVGPILARHRLCVLPRILERSCAERQGSLDLMLLHVTVRAAFDFVSAEDGSAHVVESFGEALDASDKGTAKAMQSAYKYALLQAFCVPLGVEDADAVSAKLRSPLHTSEPVQGWEQWSRDVIDMVRGCASKDAVSRVQDRYRSLLVSLSRERSDLYASIGEAVAARRSEINEAAAVAQPPLAAPRAPTRPAPAARRTVRASSKRASMPAAPSEKVDA